MTTSLNAPHEAPQHGQPVNADSPLSIDRPGDALALVRHTFGDLPQDSLVVVGLSAGTTGGHLRMDLDPVLRDPDRGVALAASWLAGEEAQPAPEAAFAVVFSGPSMASSEGGCEPDAELLDSAVEMSALMQQLRATLVEHYSVPLVRTWHVSGDAIRDGDCADPQCCPYPGTPVGPALQQAWERCPELASSPGLPSSAAEIQEFLSELPRSSPHSPSSAYSSSSPRPAGEMPNASVALSLWDMAISAYAETGSTSWALEEQRRQILSASVGLPGFIESLMVCAAADVDTAHAGHTPRADHSRASSTDESMSRHYRAVLMGCTAAAPHWHRVEALEHLLRALVPFTEDHVADLLSGKAWVEWAKGRGSAADEALKHAYAYDPAHPSARFLQALFEVTGPCPWARVKRDSYGWWSSSHRLPTE